MRTNYRTGAVIPGILFIGLLGLFFLGIVELIQMRFSAGDVYPAYSSLRTDPLGTKAYYEALGSIRNISVNRNYTPLPKLTGDSTLFILGVDAKAADSIPEEELKALESFISGGGRLVMTFLPEHSLPKTVKTENNRQSNPEEKKNGTSLLLRWGLSLTLEKSPEGRKQKAEIAIEGLALPHSVPWHTPVFFDISNPAWDTVYKSADKPVMIERRYGSGTIVLSTDTYFASNEAVLKDRSPELLAWLAGPHRKIIFDETHNGIVENPGIASLFRRYNLYGLFTGFILLAGLYVWKNSVSLVPQHAAPDSETPDFMSGKDNLSGMISLLKRNIPPRQLLSVCVQEWKKGLPKTGLSGEKIRKVETAAAAFLEKPSRKELQVTTYKAIVNILSERTTHGK